MDVVKIKGLILSYCLSRCNNLALKAFGYKNFMEAFNGIGMLIGENPNNIRNMRDEFDPFFVNGRKGWTGREASPSRKVVMDFFENKSDEEVIEASKSIISNGSFTDMPVLSHALEGNELHEKGVKNMSPIKDLGEIVREIRQKMSDSFIPTEITLSDSFKQAYKAFLHSKKEKEKENVEFQKTTAIVTTAGNLNIYVPNQWFVIATYAVPLIREIIRYRDCTETIIDNNIKTLTMDDGTSLDKKRVYKALKDHTEKDLPQKFTVAAKAYFKANGNDEESSDKAASLLLQFVTDYSWWLGGKGIERTNDYYISPALSVLNLVNASQEFIAKLVFAYATEPSLYKELDSISQNSGDVFTKTFDLKSYQDIKDIPRREGGKNLIVYGAPGTGKSRMLEDEFGKAPLTRRVVFHPEYSYFDFIGTYKPVPVYDRENRELFTVDGRKINSGTPYIDYQFVPGSFTRVLVEAWLDPANMHTLLIEELNRSNAASVFGEVFQLLDRNSDGSSEYLFEPSQELREYLNHAGIEPFIRDGVGLPSNMNIVATMNSADQGVNIIDSAFKRRWNFKYLRIDIDNAVHKDAEFRYDGQIITWGMFITAVNDKLKHLRVNEDRLIGPYFIKPAELHNKSAIDKLLLYLWDDVLRHKRDQGAFAKSITGFSDLVDGFESSDVLAIKDYIQYELTPDSADEEEENEETS
jgi:type-2 restriction enzyme bsuMI component ydiS